MDLFFGTLLALLWVLLLASPLLYEAYKLGHPKPKTLPHGRYPYSKAPQKRMFRFRGR